MAVYLGDKEVGVVVESQKPDMLQTRVDGDNSCRYLFYQYTGTDLDIKNLDTSNVTNMSYMFNDCNKLINLDLSNLDTSLVTSMDCMFESNSSLTSMDLSNFKTSLVTSMAYMFNACVALTSIDLSNFDTSKVTNMYGMFSACRSLTSLDLSNFNTSLVTSMGNLFYDSQKLTSLDLSGFNTSKVTNMTNMFSYCKSLTDIIGTLDMIKVTNYSGMFSNCKALTNVTLKNIKLSLQIGSGTSYGTLLTDNTIINTFKELHDLTGSTSQTLKLSEPSYARAEAIYVKLVEPTEEQITADPNIIYKKNCVVCESTDEGSITLKEYGISKNWNISK